MTLNPLCNECNHPLIQGTNWAPSRVKVNRLQCKDCATKKHRLWLNNNRSKAREINKRHRLNKPETHMVYEANKRAKAAGVPFAITPADISIPKTCPVLGIELRFSAEGKPTANSPALDRIIPELGYVPSNIAVISHRANNLKGNGTLDELRKIVRWLEKRPG